MFRGAIDRPLLDSQNSLESVADDIPPGRIHEALPDDARDARICSWLEASPTPVLISETLDGSRTALKRVTMAS